MNNDKVKPTIGPMGIEEVSAEEMTVKKIKKKDPVVYKIYPLNEKYQIQCDPFCYKLQSKTLKGWKTLGYHTSLKSLVVKLYDLDVRQNINNLKFIIQLRDELIEAVSKFADPPKI